VLHAFTLSARQRKRFGSSAADPICIAGTTNDDEWSDGAAATSTAWRPDSLIAIGIAGRVFGAGASVASVVWFTLLGTGAQRLAPILAKPTAWRVLDGIIAAVMAVMGVSLLVV
jgi:hypothetical protein